MIHSVFIVDDHPLICTAIEALLTTYHYSVAAIAHSGDFLIAQLHQRQPDVLLLDLTMPGRAGIPLIADIKRILPQQKIIVFTASESLFYQRCCLQLGVEGYVCKRGELNTLLKAIKAVERGQRFYPITQASANVQELIDSEKLMSLTRRELMVLVKLASGMSNKQIASQLQLSSKTVSTYKIKILRKLGLKGVSGINTAARENELV
ncbi:response regulator transcription factor [Candidatus Pantoea soli]|uniref:DNA-binding response regulator n=1 Tax=Candidatus Pantoea soli TaxID=3098669 RepID=A0A518XFM7_9GAMM|nr:response regulator transcription factor [Pantoea soli]QDY43020.1 DNA-binding response regulator [Pantoea soli]